MIKLTITPCKATRLIDLFEEELNELEYCTTCAWYYNPEQASMAFRVRCRIEQTNEAINFCRDIQAGQVLKVVNFIDLPEALGSIYISTKLLDHPGLGEFFGRLNKAQKYFAKHSIRLNKTVSSMAQRLIYDIFIKYCGKPAKFDEWNMFFTPRLSELSFIADELLTAMINDGSLSVTVASVRKKCYKLMKLLSKEEQV